MSVANHARSAAGDGAAAFVSWLVTGALGPAVVALPVNLVAGKLAGAAMRWFKRFKQTDDLSRLVNAAAGTSARLSRDEIRDMRALLEKEQTWNLLAGDELKVQELTDQIAACLPARDGRTSEDSREAAGAIARGLLEFAIFDLEPEIFQRVVLARLQQMAGQASALDEALFRMHMDLYDFVDDAKDLFKRVMDRLPPGPADLGEIVVYLKTLIDWVNTDPWPRDRRFGGPALTPAAIERKLRVTVTGRAGGQEIEADDLVQHCRRLVVLGNPGAGKTWLAKRAARRCAERALELLAAGEIIDDVELPLYTTCARLFSAVGDVREAVVSSALDQLADLGGSRLTAALRIFFTERNAPTLLVIDSLDEAPGSSQRLRQADTLPWRIMLTSRPSSWNHQLDIMEGNNSHQVGELQPFRYPDDVEPFIKRWFGFRPEWGDALAAQLAQRKELQQTVTVPLILAFYCIVGAGEPLPEFRCDLYPMVLRRMLTGRWRDNDDSQPDLDACLRTLRSWAWSGATSHPISGVGTWTEDISAEPVRLGEAEERALDHVATPVGLADIDTGKVLRRFVHRSLREQLVAEQVARLPARQAAETLLPHIWYDPDWEYAASAAIAMHPQRDQVLQKLVRRAARSKRLSADLSVIDGRGEFLKLLARAAAESRNSDWSPDNAKMIGQARVQLARLRLTETPGGAESWELSNRDARDALLDLMTNEPRGSAVAEMAGEIVRLAPTAEDKGQARAALLRVLASQTDGWTAADLAVEIVPLELTAQERLLARGTLLGLLKTNQAHDLEVRWLVRSVIALAPKAEDRRQARQALLELLASQSDGPAAAHLASGVAQLDPTPQDKRQARKALLGTLPNRAVLWTAGQLADTLVQLDPTPEDARSACEALIKFLAAQPDATALAWSTSGLVRSVVQLSVTMAAEDRQRVREALLGLLARQTDGLMAAKAAADLASGIAQLRATAGDKRQAREILLRLLTSQISGPMARNLVDAMARLDPTAEDKRQVREAVTGMLTSLANRADTTQLADVMVRLATAAEDKQAVREALLRLLTSQTDGTAAASLTHAVAELDPTPDDKRQARDTLLSLLTSGIDGTAAAGLTRALAELDPAPEDTRQARDALLRLLSKETSSWAIGQMSGEIVRLAATADARRQARQALLGSLASNLDTREAIDLFDKIHELDPTAEEQCQARKAVLRLLIRRTAGWKAHGLAAKVVRLDLTVEEKRRARAALLRLLGGRNEGWMTESLVQSLIQLYPASEDKPRARQALLRLLRTEADGFVAAALAQGIIGLDPAAEDKRQACQALLRLLAADPGESATALTHTLAELGPTCRDLSTQHTWAHPPPARLLAAVRQNSAPAAWLEFLPSLASIEVSAQS